MATKKARKAAVRRKTGETDVAVELNLDGTGAHSVSTTMPFLDHMLSLMAKHGLVDLKLKARGDTDVDYHHTVEDVGIVLGQAVKKALGDVIGIRRYGSASVPMDEALAQVSLDISGRPFLVYNVALKRRSKIKDFDADLVEDFMQAFAASAGVTLHVNVPYGRNSHHMLEAAFKALGRALGDAVELHARVKGAPSTKGRI
ncbi:MAG: imidazoleglycerol-phosphate dehydratase HisB [Nitrospirota bacterium]